MRPIQRATTVQQIVGDELLVLDRGSNRLHHLNPTASWIYQRCDGRNSVAVMVDALVDTFAVARETAERDLLEALKELRALRLISTDG